MIFMQAYFHNYKLLENESEVHEIQSSLLKMKESYIDYGMHYARVFIDMSSTDWPVIALKKLDENLNDCLSLLEEFFFGKDEEHHYVLASAQYVRNKCYYVFIGKRID